MCRHLCTFHDFCIADTYVAQLFTYLQKSWHICADIYVHSTTFVLLTPMQHNFLPICKSHGTQVLTCMCTNILICVIRITGLNRSQLDFVMSKSRQVIKFQEVVFTQSLISLFFNVFFVKTSFLNFHFFMPQKANFLKVVAQLPLGKSPTAF